MQPHYMRVGRGARDASNQTERLTVELAISSQEAEKHCVQLRLLRTRALTACFNVRLLPAGLACEGHPDA